MGLQTLSRHRCWKRHTEPLVHRILPQGVPYRRSVVVIDLVLNSITVWAFSSRTMVRIQIFHISDMVSQGQTHTLTNKLNKLLKDSFSILLTRQTKIVIIATACRSHPPYQTLLDITLSVIYLRLHRWKLKKKKNNKLTKTHRWKHEKTVCTLWLP